jgi:hypothetical protein
MSATVSLPASQVPVLAEADVVVIGAGNSGFVAAIAAARAGAKVVLLERQSFVGGCNTATYNTTPGWTNDSDGNQIVGGIGWEFVLRMEKARGAIVNHERKSALFYPEVTKDVALEMLVEAGVELFLFTWADTVLAENGQVRGVVCTTKSGRVAVLGRQFVDCSGDADIAAGAGGQFYQTPATQEDVWQTSLDLTVCNIDVPRVLRWCRQNSHLLECGGKNIPPTDDYEGINSQVSITIKGGETRDYERDLAGKPLQTHEHLGTYPTLKLMPRRSTSRVQGNTEIDTLDVRQLTHAVIAGRRGAHRHLAYIQSLIDGTQDAFIVGESPLGVRESRVILGEYFLTIDDLIHNARFDDVVCLNARVIDKHTRGDRITLTRLIGNHDVPLRALLPKGTVNVVVAGRSVSCDHESHASIRGAATCWATGQAAGTVAALCALHHENPRTMDLGRLQRTLVQHGQILSTNGRTFA